MLNLLTMIVNDLDRLIELCRDYIQVLDYKAQPLEFVQWVILLTRSNSHSRDYIERKFLLARLWGHDDKLINIKNQLDIMMARTDDRNTIASDPRIIESSVSIGYYRIDVTADIGDCQLDLTVESDNHELSRIYSMNECYIIISSSPTLEVKNDQIRTRLNTLSIVDAHRVALIIKNELGLKETIRDLIPNSYLIHLNIKGFQSLYLWKGTDGIIIAASKCINLYIGRLNSGCTGIYHRDGDDVPPSLITTDSSTRIHCSNLLMNLHDTNPVDHQQLLELVQANVNNPDNYVSSITTEIK